MIKVSWSYYSLSCHVRGWAAVASGFETPTEQQHHVTSCNVASHPVASHHVISAYTLMTNTVGSIHDHVRINCNKLPSADQHRSKNSEPAERTNWPGPTEPPWHWSAGGPRPKGKNRLSVVFCFIHSTSFHGYRPSFNVFYRPSSDAPCLPSVVHSLSSIHHPSVVYVSILGRLITYLYTYPKAAHSNCWVLAAWFRMK